MHVGAFTFMWVYSVKHKQQSANICGFILVYTGIWVNVNLLTSNTINSMQVYISLLTSNTSSSMPVYVDVCLCM